MAPLHILVRGVQARVMEQLHLVMVMDRLYLLRKISPGETRSPLILPCSYGKGDALYLNTMLSSDYQDVYAGVAIFGDAVYFTIDAGYIAGSTIPPPIS